MLFDFQTSMAYSGLVVLLTAIFSILFSRNLSAYLRANKLDGPYVACGLGTLLICIGILVYTGLAGHRRDVRQQTTTISSLLPVPYTMVVPPNPTIEWGVAAIVPNKQKISGARAAYLANDVRNQFEGTKNRAFEIYVFEDAKSAQIFGKYQAKRRGARLRVSDYVALTRIWPHCLAYVEFNGNRRNVRYPSASPPDWWEQ